MQRLLETKDQMMIEIGRDMVKDKESFEEWCKLDRRNFELRFEVLFSTAFTKTIGKRLGFEESIIEIGRTDFIEDLLYFVNKYQRKKIGYVQFWEEIENIESVQDPIYFK